ncbi:MAG: crossover junction endodeoxyribonuclease RuvC [Chloroflexi bacterium]|nr:crossover junction endodeoxyribonuclease RuvC [Chloroflexota bacterium]
MRIIGVDPGLVTTGYGVIDANGRSHVAVEGGFSKTRASDSLEFRLKAIYQDIREVLEEHSPNHMAVEDLHSRYRNLKTAIIMGHARGVVVLAAGEAGIPVFHYQPTQAKNLVTGSGRADKLQVQRAVATHLRLADLDNEHVADAFSIAICHAMMSDSPLANAV